MSKNSRASSLRVFIAFMPKEGARSSKSKVDPRGKLQGFVYALFMAFILQEIQESFCPLCPPSSSSWMRAPLELGRREEGEETQLCAGAHRECAAAQWSCAAAHQARAGAHAWVCPVRAILPPPSARTYEGLFLGVITDLLLVYIVISTYF